MTGKKGKKARLQEAESRAAEAMQAKDAAEKQAMDLHSGVQDLSRRTEELQNQVGELDAELKSARETSRIADARAAEMANRAALTGDLEQEIAALRKQLEQVQTWSAELSAKADRAAAAEKDLRDELEKTQAQHVTVIRAKEEKVAALENRAKEGLKRLKDAHDSALREQAARATASEKEAREELKKFKELHEQTIAEMAPLRANVAELRAQVEKSDELRRDIDALSQQVGQTVGARDKLRRELDEARSMLDQTRDELKKSQDLRGESERAIVTLRVQTTDLERRLKEAPKEDPRICGLQKELAGMRDELKKSQDLRASSEREGAGFKTQVAGLQKDLAALRDELKKSRDLRAASEREGAGLKTQLGGLQKDLAALRDELKKSQDLRTASEREGAGLRTQVAGSQKDLAAVRDELKKSQDLRGASERDSVAFKARVAGLQNDVSGLRDELKKAQDLRGVADRENLALKAHIAEVERRIPEGSREDPRVATLQKDLVSMKARAEKAEAKSAETARYFESMEKQLIESRDEADKAESLRGELEKMKEACREHEEGLDQLSETIMELQHQLDSAAEATPAPTAASVPTTEKPVVLENVAPIHPFAGAPTLPPASSPAPNPQPTKIEIDIELEAPPSPPSPPPAPKPVVLPPAVPVPNSSSAETTLRSNNTFGPIGTDGQPIYLLHELLPKDAKGVVYRATERADGRAFAVRFMGGQAGEEQTRAFEKEVEKLISLPHPNILHVQGTGRRKNRLYVMMDLVDAPPLSAAKIQEIPRICAILRDAAAAVHYAHEEGIFHGDLNLETILVGKEEDQDLALVKDFGLAYLLETQTAGLRNPAFLPPEQVRVLKSPLSVAVDVYGLGATLFAALTGRAPFEGKDAAQVVKRVMIEEPPPVEKLRSDIPKAVGAVVRRAMAKERGVRYATAGEFSDALSKCC